MLTFDLHTHICLCIFSINSFFHIFYERCAINDRDENTGNVQMILERA